MTHFTDSPIESMMARIPRYRPESELPISVSTHACTGCGFRRGHGCIGICYRELRRNTSGQDKTSPNTTAVSLSDAPPPAIDEGRCSP